ncbi:MAG TPA: hypothetical protein DCX54_05475, partial [Flavobacteriales bacterium]|nr:hypothetical protein [Flavobacteriales bacterium]
MTAQSGAFDWAGKLRTDSTFNIFDTHVDEHSNFYLTGGFTGNVDFDPSSGLSVLRSIGRMDIFIAKYDRNGNLKWAKQMISQDSSKFHYFNRMSGKAILTDKNGNIYYTGTFYGTVDFDPGSGTDIRTATSTDVFLSKLDSNGNLVWFSHFETILRGGYNYSQAMTLDGKNHLLISGIFQGIIDFDPGPGIDTISSPKYKNQYSEATYICKYDLNGNHIWAKRIGALYGHCGVITMNSDTLSNVYLGGSFWGKVDFDPDTGTFIGEATPGASSSGFLTKLDSNGYFSFAKIFIPNYPDYNQSTNVGVTNINIKNNGNILLSGGFTGKVDFDPDTGKHYLYSHSDQNYLFIIELNHIGALNWVIDFDGLNSGSMPVAMDDSDN